MGIKRCPSFSKRPGFPCGLRVLLVDSDAAARAQSEALLQECSYEVTLCASVAEATERLAGSCSFDVLVADKPSLSACPPAAQAALMDAASGLPCILMSSAPQPQDIMQGLELGAVDFLCKPLAPQKLRNIWQHTVRKMMCNMTIECDGADGVPLPPLPVGKERVSMEVILEDAEAEEAAAAARAAGATPRSSTSAPPAAAGPGGSVINYSNAPNMALAITSSFYGPSSSSAAQQQQQQQGLDRSASSAAEARCASPDSPDARPAKQQHCHHGPVRACPSTRSLNSMSSCQSNWALPGSPSTPSLARLSSDATTTVGAAAATTPEADSCLAEGADRAACAQRCMRKAVRHPAAASAAASPVASACKPPLCGKPAAATQAAVVAATPVSTRTQPAAPAAAAPAQQQPSSVGMPAPAAASVPLPTGLGPLPQGMVWGMPMLPLVRAPGIVPPAIAAPAAPVLAAGVAALPPPPPAWGMCGPAPAGMFMGYGGMPLMHAGSYGAMMHPGGMPYVDAASAMQASAYAASVAHHQYACMQQQQQQPAIMVGVPQEQQHQQQQHQATGAAAAAALGGIDLLGSSSGAAARMDADEEDAALDFVLGDIAAEDDCIAGVCGSLLDADMPALDEGGLALPAQVPAAMPALEAELQHHHSARPSFDCSAATAAAGHHHRISFDCSSASTATAAARASFETSAHCSAQRVKHSSRVSFEVSQMSRCSSARASFEVASMHMGELQQHHHMAELAAPHMDRATLAALGDSVKATPFPAPCSDDSSQGSGSALPRVDSCGMLADLQTLFAASGDSGCHADSAVADGEELFVDALDDMPLGLALRKSSSLAQLINAGLPVAGC